MKSIPGILITCVGVALVLSLTLWPTGEVSSREVGFLCIFCGPRDLADGLLNLALFVPLGAGLALIQGPLLALGGSCVLSGIVEVAQLTIPGRFPSVQDLGANTLGGLCGGLLVIRHTRIAAAFLRPPPKIRVAWMSVPITVFLATGWLFSPHFPDSVYFGQWTHDLGSLERYRGQVLSASIGGISLPDGRVPDQVALRAALESAEEIRFHLVVAPEPPPSLTHVLAIYDHHRTEIFLVGVQGTDLVFRRRTLSAILLLDQPEVRWVGALRAQAGDTVPVAIRQERSDLCFQFGSTNQCGLAPGSEHGWQLLHGAPTENRFLIGVLGATWLLFLALPAGLTNQRRWLAKGLLLTFAYVAIGWANPWLSVHPEYVLVPALGVWAGAGLRRILPRDCTSE